MPCASSTSCRTLRSEIDMNNFAKEEISMFTTMVPVESSDLSAVGYDDSSATLTIEFRRGGMYEYSQVPYCEFLNR